MIDLHAHILPGIDDGARDMSMALEMLEIASKESIESIIVTPHFIYGDIDNTEDIVTEQLAELKAAAEEKGIQVNLYPGSEIFICPELPELLKEKKVCTLNHSRYVLIELPMAMVPEYTDEVLYGVRLLGYTPVIAHPERNMVLGRNLNMVENLVRQGALTQVNATSITGLYGKKIQKIVMKMIGRGLVHFVCSDAHTCRGRSPKLTKARQVVTQKFGKETAVALFETNGKFVIENMEIQIPAEKAIVSNRWSWIPGFSKIFGMIFRRRRDGSFVLKNHTSM